MNESRCWKLLKRIKLLEAANSYPCPIELQEYRAACSHLAQLPVEPSDLLPFLRAILVRGVQGAELGRTS